MIAIATQAPVPHYGIGSVPKLDLRRVPTGAITRRWARDVYRVQREALEWARTLPRSRDGAEAETAGEAANEGDGDALTLAPDPGAAPVPPLFAPPDIPPALIPLLRPPGEWKRQGIAMPRFRYVYYCKRRSCYGFSVPPTGTKPRCNGSPFGTEIEAAEALHRATGGALPPTKEGRRKARKAEGDPAHVARPHPYRRLKLKGKAGVKVKP